jgi:hypothetical protein
LADNRADARNLRALGSAGKGNFGGAGIIWGRERKTPAGCDPGGGFI